VTAVPAVNLTALHRTLDQELVAILRRASLECPVCGEFLLHRADGIGCPQCGLELQGEAVVAERLTDTPAVGPAARTTP
jgi:predicted amidophosphoribosyltransferase